MTMIADALGCPVVASTEPEATSRGTALLALEALGVLPGFADAPVLLGDTFEPSPENHAIYQKALARQKHLYQRVIADVESGPSRP
jgi:gluconokinase